MANDYKPLNRNQLWNSPQKKAIKKAFTALETAAAAGDHDAAGATRKDISRILVLGRSRTILNACLRGLGKLL